ncbi:MFS transporter [Microbacterium sp. SSW1-49]|uniref:MFS transporter n=1 Tax=Microbacterium croceum TaxID=2851645 RepID=A0ABT0FBD2_9MICO|nr:MFS transporter [Microbacterium croceum]MCK2035239.1 MFS transporter [Microbacterium croceum]
MPVLISVLALAIFAQGTSEFMLAGLLLPISEEFGVPPGSAAAVTSAFAIGMVIGAPAMALLGSRWHPRRTLIAFLLVFVLAHIAGALAPSFAVLLVTRVVAAIANAGFLAVSLSTVRTLVPPQATTRAVATLLAGTTLATIVGVPAGAALADALGWRATFWGVVLLCGPALGALLLDRSPLRAGGAVRIALRTELGALARRRVLGAIAVAVVINAGTFGVFTFLGVIGESAGVATAFVPLLLAAFGIGAFLGVAATGRWAAGREGVWVASGMVALLLAWAALWMLIESAAAVFALSAACGALSFAVGSAVIGRIVREAAGAPVLGGASATVALNLGAFIGPLLAGAAYGAVGAPGVLAVAVALTVVGVGASVWASSSTRDGDGRIHS